MRIGRRMLQDARVAMYLNHLNPTPGQDLTPLSDIVPAAGDGMEAVKKFHYQLFKTMEEAGNSLIGFKVVPPNCDVLKALRATEEVVTPIFAKSRRDSGCRFSTGTNRLQHASCSLTFELSRDVQPNAPAVELEAALETFCPSLELLRSRFPYYATHVEGFAADLGSHAFLVVGDRCEARRVRGGLSELGMAFLRDNVPVQVGYVSHCLGSPLNAAITAARYAQSLGVPLKKGHLLVCSGLSQRVPLNVKGKYEIICGPYGSVVCTLD